MKKTYSFEDCYQILGLNPDCSWSELRKTYKKSIQKWHPDRFEDGSKEKAAANDKIKTINIAYNQVYKYYRTKGILPSITQRQNTKSSTVKKNPSSSRGKDKKATATSRPPRKKNKQCNQYKSPTGKEKSSFHPFASSLLIISLLGTAYYYFSADINYKTSDTAYINNKINAKPLPSTNEKLNQAETNQNHLQDILKQESLTERKQLEDKHLNEDEYFTSGSSISDVIGIQGAPTSTDGETWYYGDSEVYFSEGVVTHWFRADTPLKARIKIEIPETYKLNKLDSDEKKHSL